MMNNNLNKMYSGVQKMYKGKLVSLNYGMFKGQRGRVESYDSKNDVMSVVYSNGQRGMAYGRQVDVIEE